MTKREQEKFIKECRSWIGTPWIHGQGTKGVGVDCVYFVSEVAKNMGWLNKDYVIEPYPKDWAFHKKRNILWNELQKFCNEIPLSQIQIGDILTYKYTKKTITHIAFYLGNNKAIHSHRQYGVVEFNIEDRRMKRLFYNVMRWRGNNK